MSTKYEIDKSITVTKADERYINKEFESNNHGKFTVLGVHSVGNNYTKKYLCYFENGGYTISEGGAIRSSSIKPDNASKEDVDFIAKPKIEESILNENHKLRKQLQKSRDDLRILRKSDRGEFRNHEVYDSFMDSMFSIVDTYKRKNKPIISVSDNKKVAIMQFSDHHICQKIDLPNNKYDVEIARDRLFRYIDKTVNEYLIPLNITEINIFFTGDLFNLDFLTDQLLTNQYVRAEAFVRGYDLYCEVVEYLLELGYSISIASILGNESRLNTREHMSNVDYIAKDNFDYICHQMLKRRFNDVKFLNEGDQLEDMINVNGKNIILTHGNNLKHSNLMDSINKLKLRWQNYSGIYADYALFGHIHQSLIDSGFARSSSLCGGNSYSDKKLNIPSSTANQNLFLVGKDISGIIINCEKEKIKHGKN